MDTTFYIFKISTSISHQILKIKASLDDIENKHPERTDLIGSMTESLNDLVEIRQAWDIVTRELSIQSKRLNTLEIEHLKLLADLKEVRNVKDRMFNDLNL
tara:strand:+ start:130 stop:432 length:303 start_codon:yes stop_codon:yes gene_type:complete